MAKESDVLSRVLEAFAHGVCFARSFTHPYVADRIGGLWVLRDAPRKSGDYRKEEWVAYQIAPERVDQTARKHTRGHFAICAICAAYETGENLRSAYKNLGYRLGSTEPVMAHDLMQIPRLESPAKISRVKTLEVVDRVNQLAGARQILPVHLEKGSALREYIAMIEDEPAGWVRSIDVDQTTWYADLHVQPKFRRRGIASAMLSYMLREDRARGIKMSALTSSHAALNLYLGVGFKQLGTLMGYTLRKG